LEDGSIFRHKDERKVKTAEEESLMNTKLMNIEFEDIEIHDEDEEKKSNELKNENEEDLQSKEKNESTNDLDDEKEEEENLFPETSFKLKLVANIEKY
jgi:hypothetical protein